MRKTARRILFYVLLSGGILASLWWFTHIPRRPERLYRVIPADADWISVHRRPAVRWPDWVAFPAWERVAGVLGADAVEGWSAIRHNADVSARLAEWIPEELVLARFRVPGMGRHAWVAATWLGDRSIRYRWLLEQSGRWSGIAPAGQYAGRRLWYIPRRYLPDGWTGTFAFDEGVLIACASPFPGDLRFVLDAYDGVAARAPEAERVRQAAGDDVAWCRGSLVSGTPGWEAYSGLLDVRLHAGGLRMNGDIRGPASAPAPAADASGDFQELSAILGDAPDVLVSLDRALFSALGERLPSNHWGRIAWEFVEDNSRGPVHLSFYGPDHGGRFSGMRVPGVLLAVRRTAAEPAFHDALSQWMDRVNAGRQWGLIAAPLAGGLPGLRTVEGTTDTAFSRMPPNERPCVAHAGDWVLISASSETMETLLAPGREKGVPVWADAGPPGTADLWIHPTRGVRTARLAAAVYSLWLISREGGDSAHARARIQRQLEWLDVLTVFDRFRLNLRPEGEGGWALNLQVDASVPDEAAAGPAR